MSTKGKREEEPSIVKLMRYSAWFFLFVLAIIAVIILVKGPLAHTHFFTGMNIYTESTMYLSLVGAGLFFGLSSYIKENPNKTVSIFKDLLISMIIFDALFILILAAYQW